MTRSLFNPFDIWIIRKASLYSGTVNLLGSLACQKLLSVISVVERVNVEQV